MIDVRNAVKQIGGSRVLDGVSFTLAEGGMYGIIGPNGAGKSTLLSLLSGVEPAGGGSVNLRGEPVKAYKRKDLARWVGVLQQEGLPATAFTVREVVGMGRYPHQNWLGHEEKDAGELIESAMRTLGLTELAERRLSQLSGGERQRVALAKVMVQEPELILLDEPTTYLDIGHQVQLLDAVRDWQKQKRLTAVAVFHDLNLAAQYCDRLLVLAGGKLAADGTPAEVLTEETISRVYGTDPIVLRHPDNGAPQVLLRPRAARKSDQTFMPLRGTADE